MEILKNSTLFQKWQESSLPAYGPVISSEQKTWQQLSELFKIIITYLLYFNSNLWQFNSSFTTVFPKKANESPLEQAESRSKFCSFQFLRISRLSDSPMLKKKSTRQYRHRYIFFYEQWLCLVLFQDIWAWLRIMSMKYDNLQIRKGKISFHIFCLCFVF